MASGARLALAVFLDFSHFFQCLKYYGSFVGGLATVTAFLARDGCRLDRDVDLFGFCLIAGEKKKIQRIVFPLHNFSCDGQVTILLKIWV